MIDLRAVFYAGGSISVVLLATCLAHAESPYKNLGPGTGGGGGVVVCGAGKKVNIELVDLVESAFYDKTHLDPKLTKLSWEEQVRAVVNRIEFADPQFHAMLWERVQTVRRELEHARDDTKGTDVVFPAPQDLSHGRVPPLHLGCQVAGAAVFNDANPAGQRLRVSDFLWRGLSSSGKAALVMHEAVYLTHRDVHRNLEMDQPLDSSATRALVGFLFSKELGEISTTAAERARFLAHSWYRGVDLAGFPKVLALLEPIGPYFAKNVERPLFLDSIECKGGDYVVKTQADPACHLSVVAHRGIGVSLPQPLKALDDEGGWKRFGYRRHSDQYLEDILLTCERPTKGKHSNPGFKVFCGEDEIADIPATTARDVNGLSIKNKHDFENTFTRDFQFE